jgi:hypothetical protein
VTLYHLQRAMARAVLPAPVADTLGDITLFPHQQQAVARLLRALRWFRGALLADDVGLGKTYSALAVATRYRQVHVLAPAGLLTMWRGALRRTAQPHVALHSLHGASRGVPDVGPASPDTLVIIDEAHVLRNANTARYRNVATAVAGSHVLLLSATPLHNTPQDLSTLIGLFLGARRNTLRNAQLAQLVVRRDAELLHPGSVGASTAAPRTPPRQTAPQPVVRRHRALVMPQHRTTLDAILSLPAPIPARDGAVATALIKLGLLRAWCSSDAALTHAIVRRILRTEALQAALQSDRHPTNEELRAWAIGDDHVQLAFPELMTATTPTIAPPAQAVRQHLEALRALHARHTQSGDADRLRAQALRQIRDTHPDTPIVAFSQYTRTVQALYRALSDIAGVGMIAGSTARIASGAITRTDLLEHFAPRAHGRPPPPAHLAVTLLLTTDLLAEGVNLQDAGVVVHLDLPWTAALEAQRVGRIVRIGSPHATAHVYRFAASTPLRRALRSEALLAQKQRLTQRHVGGTGRVPHAVRTTPTSAADAQSAWFATLTRWASGTPPPHRRHSAHSVDPSDARHPAQRRRITVALPMEYVRCLYSAGDPAEPIAPLLTHGAIDALVLVHLGTRRMMLRVVRTRRGWRVSMRAASLSQVARVLDRIAGQTEDGPAQRASVRPGALRERARLARVVRRWHARRSVAVLAGHTMTADVTDSLTGQHRTALQWLQRVVTSLSTVERAALRQEISAARACIERARGAAALDALNQWMQAVQAVKWGPPRPVADQLQQWQAYEVLARTAAPPSGGPDSAMPTHAVPGVGRCVITAMIAITVEA